MWRVGDKRRHVGHHRNAEPVPIGQYHRNRLSVLDRHVDIVGIGQSSLDLAARDHVANHRVAVGDSDVVGFETAEEIVHLLVAEGRVQRRDVKGRRAESRIGHSHLSTPSRVGEIEDRLWRILQRDQLRVVGDDADARRKAGPESFGIDQRRWYTCGARGSVCCEHTLRLQYQRANRFIRPEHVGAWTRLLGKQTIGESGGLRFLGVVHDVHAYAGASLVLTNDRLREWPIGGHVCGDLPRCLPISCISTAGARHNEREARADDRSCSHEPRRSTCSRRRSHRTASRCQLLSKHPLCRRL